VTQSSVHSVLTHEEHGVFINPLQAGDSPVRMSKSALLCSEGQHVKTGGTRQRRIRVWRWNGQRREEAVEGEKAQ
jgi:hypothetical protein